MTTIAERLDLLAAGLAPGQLGDLGRRLPSDVVAAVLALLTELPPPTAGRLLRLAVQRTVTLSSIDEEPTPGGSSHENAHENAPEREDSPEKGPDNSIGNGDVISDLVAQGLLRAVDDRAGAWRVAPLLHRSVVQQQRERDPRAARLVHDRLVEMLLAADPEHLDGDLLFHARLAGRWDVLAWMWKCLGIGLTRRHPDLVAWAYRALPPPVVRPQPALRLAELVAEAVSGDGQLYRNRRLLRVIAADIDTILAGLSLCADSEMVLESGTLAMIAMRDTGNVPAANQVVDLVEDELSRRSGAAHAQAWALFCLEAASSRLLAGRVVDVRHYAATAIAEATGVDGGAGPRSQAQGLLALADGMLGWTDRARRRLAEIRLPSPPGTDDDRNLLRATAAALPARLAAAHIAADELDLELLDEIVDSLDDPEDPTHLWPHIMVARCVRALLTGRPLQQIPELDRVAAFRRDWLTERALATRLLGRCRTELLLAGGQVQRTAAILRSTETLPAELRVPMARLHLHTEDFGAAHRFTAQVLADPTLTPRERGTFEIIHAAALLGLGRDDQVPTFLRENNAGSGFPPGHTFQLALLPAATRTRLLDLSPTEPTRQPIRERLLTLGGPAPVHESRLVQLTARESVVLRQLGTNRTLAQIAEQLSVSVNTVKKQSIAVYRKLGVTDRDSAVTRAGRLGLLDNR